MDKNIFRATYLVCLLGFYVLIQVRKIQERLDKMDIKWIGTMLDKNILCLDKNIFKMIRNYLNRSSKFLQIIGTHLFNLMFLASLLVI